MGVSIRFHMDGIDDVLVRLDPLLDVEPGPLMDGIAALGESQTRRRIESEKTAPDGTPWKENHTGTPILRRTGRHLLDSVASVSGSEHAEWGASWEFAHVHQTGMTIVPRSAKALAFSIGGNFVMSQEVTVPARPFVGLSEDNRGEILDLVSDYFRIGGLQ